MDIVKFNREMEQHQLHLKRIKTVKPCVDTSTPTSLGLKHLATRPKKQQLIDDRNQSVARENKKLMEKMAKIMTEKRGCDKHVLVSLNEVERKLTVDRINFDNQLMVDRLHNIQPVLSKSKFEQDFSQHMQISQQLRRRQMKPIHTQGTGAIPSATDELFDSNGYIAQHATSGMLAGEESQSPIKSMSEFRKHVISSKRAPGLMN